MPDIKKSIRREVKTIVTIERAELSTIIRAAIGAPNDADVDINDGWSESAAIVSWTVVEEVEQ